MEKKAISKVQLVMKIKLRGKRYSFDHMMHFTQKYAYIFLTLAIKICYKKIYFHVLL